MNLPLKISIIIFSITFSCTVETINAAYDGDTQFDPVDELKVETVGETVEAPPVQRTRKRRKKAVDSLFRYTYDISVINDDNIRLAQNDLDIRSDLVTSMALQAKGTLELDKFSILDFGTRATYNKFKTFDTLDSLDFDINARFRFGFNAGFTAPTYFVGGSIGGTEFTETEMRDSNHISLSAGLNKWITNTISMNLGWGYRKHESKSRAYDTSQNSLFVNLDTNLSSTSLVYTTITYATGDIVSSATPTLDIINAADVIEPDDAFGGIGLNQFAYRIDTDTIIFTFGYNKIITQGLSLDVSARFVESTASSIGYDRTLLTAGLLGRF
ncbi:MAG: hypothetical protein GY806_10950 [Gammaproteobacteria bacterium]|nr:hypothetical protein [Gammaproteobacteria bacterium]